MSVKAPPTPGTATWYDLTTGRPDECRTFYGHLFGWTIPDSTGEHGGYVQIRKGGRNVAGFMPKDESMAGLPSTWTVYLASQDAHADAARIRELGGQVLAEPMQVDQLGCMVVATDPTGAPFGLWQPLDFQGSELENEHGGMTWQEVLTRDAAKARAFYTDLFGLTSEPMPGPMTYHTLHVAPGTDAVAGIMQMDDAHWPDSVPPHWMPYFAVNDVQAAVTTAAEHGGAVQVTPFDSPYGTIAILADPDGATFSVIQLS